VIKSARKEDYHAELAYVLKNNNDDLDAWHSVRAFF